MTVSAQSNNPIFTQGSSFGSGIDGLMYPELAQRIATCNQVALSYLENSLVEASMWSQKELAVGSVTAGFGSATSTAIFGAVEGAGGGLTGAGSVAQVKSAMKSAEDLTAVKTEATIAHEELRHQRTDEYIQLQPRNGDLAATTPPGGAGTIQAANQSPATTPAKSKAPRTSREIDSGLDVKVEEIKTKNNEEQQRANLFQSAQQASQFLAQGSQANQKVCDTSAQGQSGAGQTAQQIAQTANQMVQFISGVDTQRQNSAR